MRSYSSLRSTLFPPEVTAQPSKRPYSPWAPLAFFFIFAMAFVGLVVTLQFLWPALNSTFIRVFSLVAIFGLVFAARKAGLLPKLSHAEAGQLSRGISFLSWSLGMAVMWVAFSAVFENRISLDNVICAVLIGLMWAALDS